MQVEKRGRESTDKMEQSDTTELSVVKPIAELKLETPAASATPGDTASTSKHSKTQWNNNLFYPKLIFSAQTQPLTVNPCDEQEHIEISSFSWTLHMAFSSGSGRKSLLGLETTCLFSENIFCQDSSGRNEASVFSLKMQCFYSASKIKIFWVCSPSAASGELQAKRKTSHMTSLFMWFLLHVLCVVQSIFHPMALPNYPNLAEYLIDIIRVCVAASLTQ